MTKIIEDRKYKYRVDLVSENNKVIVKLDYSNMELVIGFSIDIKDEIFIRNLCYSSNSDNTILKIIDFYFELLNNKPVEIFDRISLKEIEAFINNGKRASVIGPYSSEHLEILKIGNLIYQKVTSKDNTERLFDPGEYGEFLSLSFSEQVEFFEEFCAKYVYQDVKFKDVEIDILEIENNIILIESQIEDDLLKVIEKNFNKTFYTGLVFKKK